MYRILIADDESIILNGLRKFIDWEEHGIEVVECVKSGSEALQYIEKNDVDILLTDIRMPAMDGLELIRRVKNSGKNIRFIILSGYDDFEYMKQALKLGIENYLLKPVNRDELSTTLLDVIEKIKAERRTNQRNQRGLDIYRDNMLNRWVCGSLSGDELMEKASLAGIELNSDYYVVSIIRLVGKKDQRKEDIGGVDYSAALKLCGKICKTEEWQALFQNLDGDIILLFGSNGEVDKVKIKEKMNECIDEINRRLLCDVFITVGSKEAGYLNVHKSYKSANELQGYSLIITNNSVVDYEETERATSERQKEFIIDFKLYDKMLSAGDIDGCCRFIHEIFTRLKSNSGVTPAFVQIIAIELMFHLVMIVKDFPKGNLFDYTDIDFRSLYSAHTIEELEEFLKNTMMKAEGVIKKKDYYSPYVSMVLSYIDENYNKDLSITQLSKKFKINAAYLGQLFKNETGEMLTNYINKIRVEKAKNMLLTTTLKASAISERVGYQNTNYFYRVFKKLTGVSPSEYR